MLFKPVARYLRELLQQSFSLCKSGQIREEVHFSEEGIKYSRRLFTGSLKGSEGVLLCFSTAILLLKLLGYL